MYHCNLCGATNTIDDEPCWQCMQLCEVEMKKKFRNFIEKEIRPTLKRYKIKEVKEYSFKFEI
jgi:hypothetical protein